MTDTFDDLAALATKGAAAGSNGQLRRSGPYWSYPGCAMSGTNLRLPVEGALDARVQAALVAGAWVVREVDGDGNPVAVVPATSMWAARPPLRPATVGTGESLPRQLISFVIVRPASDGQTSRVMGGEGTWWQAWIQGVVAEPSGVNLNPGLLTFRTSEPDAVVNVLPPVSGDRLFLEGRGILFPISNVSVIDAQSKVYDLVLQRSVPTRT